MKNYNRYFHFFRTMKFGIALLIAIMLISIVGTVVPQGMDEHFYTSRYSSVVANLIIGLSLNNIYNSIIFGILFIALTLNLVMCSILRLGRVINKLKAKPSLETMDLLTMENIDAYDSIHDAVNSAFKWHGFKKIYKDKLKEGKYYLVKNKVGFFGSWFLHLGILLAIVFYAYGSMTYFSEGVFGVPGSVQQINGTEYKVKINNFNVEYRTDGSVQQYTSNVELLDNSGAILKASDVSVNSPMRYKGYTFYQTAYGWAANCSVSKSGDNIFHELIYEKTTLNLTDENISIYFNMFYPDFAASSQGFGTLSDQLKNPVVLYSLIYMGKVVKMDIVPTDEIIKWNEYEFVFKEPQRYTYLDVNRMRGQLGAAIGAVLITAGLMLVFYFKPTGLMIHVEGSKMFVYKYEPLGKSYKINRQKENDIYAK